LYAAARDVFLQLLCFVLCTLIAEHIYAYIHFVFRWCHHHLKMFFREQQLPPGPGVLHRCEKLGNAALPFIPLIACGFMRRSFAVAKWAIYMHLHRRAYPHSFCFGGRVEHGGSAYRLCVGTFLKSFLGVTPVLIQTFWPKFKSSMFHSRFVS
jgi:hypothetical protein